MNILLWILQIILAIKMLTTAITHALRQNIPTMQEAKGKFGRNARFWLSLSGLFCFLGAAGLLLPGIRVLPAQTVIYCAAFLALMLLISLICHIRSREKPKVFVSLVLFVFAAAIVIGRYFYPIL